MSRIRERIEKLEREVQGFDEESITIQMHGYPAVSIPLRKLFDPEYHMNPSAVDHYRQTGEIPERVETELAELREAKTLEELASITTLHILRAVGCLV